MIFWIAVKVTHDEKRKELNFPQMSISGANILQSLLGNHLVNDGIIYLSKTMESHMGPPGSGSI